MSEKYFFGEAGLYGPYSRQEDGWPNAGEVVRDFRHKMGISVKELAHLYGEAIKDHITEDWIYKMESQNRVPTDINRRRLLVTILHIPPTLLGLASLDDIASKPKIEGRKQSVSSLSPKQSSFDLSHYDKEARLLWQLHYSSTAQNYLHTIQKTVDELEHIEAVVSGSFQRRVWTLLNSYYRLAATITRDQGQFQQAYVYANNAVRVAKSIGDREIVAATQYTRGFINLTWGILGDKTVVGALIPNTTKINAAITDFERAVVDARPQLKGIIWLELSRAKGFTRRSETDTSIALRLIDDAERFVGQKNSSDFYTQILLDGDLKGLNTGRIYLGRAKTLIAVGRPGKAKEALDDLEGLKESDGVGRSHMRRHAWIDILHAQASLSMGDYSLASYSALQAFEACKEVHSVANIARVNDLYTQLLTTSHKEGKEVKELGKLLRSYYQIKDGRQ